MHACLRVCLQFRRIAVTFICFYSMALRSPPISFVNPVCMGSGIANKIRLDDVRGAVYAVLTHMSASYISFPFCVSDHSMESRFELHRLAPKCGVQPKKPFDLDSSTHSVGMLASVWLVHITIIVTTATHVDWIENHMPEKIRSEEDVCETEDTMKRTDIKKKWETDEERKK